MSHNQNWWYFFIFILTLISSCLFSCFFFKLQHAIINSPFPQQSYGSLFFFFFGWTRYLNSLEDCPASIRSQHLSTHAGRNRYLLRWLRWAPRTLSYALPSPAKYILIEICAIWLLGVWAWWICRPSTATIVHVKVMSYAENLAAKIYNCKSEWSLKSWVLFFPDDAKSLLETTDWAAQRERVESQNGLCSPVTAFSLVWFPLVFWNIIQIDGN